MEDAINPEQDIDYHYISRSEMDERFGEKYNGYAVWRTGFGENECDIYLLDDIKHYFNSEDCFEAVLAHEERHCAEGNWHGGDAYVEPACQTAMEEMNSN